MSKNNKKSRSDGTINSANINFPTPPKSYNDKSTGFNNSDLDKVRRETISRS